MTYAWFPAMHSRIDIALYGQPERTMQQIVNKIFTIIHNLDMLGNRFNPQSAISALNMNAAQAPCTVQPALYNILMLCRQFHINTGGLFDIAIQSDNFSTTTFPSIVFDDCRRTVHFTQPGIQLDLSGILKGYALDEIKILCQNRAQKNIFVSFGQSSIMALGDRPSGEGWLVKSNDTASDSEPAVYKLRNQFLTTSGTATDGRKHVVDPRSGKLVERSGAVSVVTDSGAWGEALATAQFIENSP